MGGEPAFTALEGLTGPGTYVLILHLAGGEVIRVGSLGSYAFPAGFYAYVGSACGPGGLAGRLRHHIAGGARPHWHVDHLRRAARLAEVWFIAQSLRREHGWAALLGRLPDATAPAARFGASDCACPTHLWHWLECPSPGAFRQLLDEHFPGDALLQRLELIV
ncbi:MAG TPA: GIY-YIG nuclease family protein [Anaerolineae bacterium]|nr:GIY-YIG nuclease family protein [Anaerolineae bacterium]HOQ99355.1 GIY-YIG nuclease family protein [Anaerolineae bacterium]HPL26792.1 GIY-YIG nuclease family protein [Anaerolineae bacterium]